MICTSSRPRRIRGQLDWCCWSHRPLDLSMSIWSIKLTLRSPWKEAHWAGSISGAVLCCATWLTVNLFCVTSDFPSRWLATWAGRYLMKIPARGVRDVTCSDGFIRLIEIEETGMVDAARPSNGSRKRAVRTPTTESYKPAGGWNAVIWKRASSLKKWIKDCTAYVSKGSIWPVLMHNRPESSESENLLVAGPIWSMQEEDIFYLMVKTDLKDKKLWALKINVRKSTLEDMTSFSEERDLFFKAEYHPFALSKYLSMTLDNSKAAAGSQIQESGYPRNSSSNTVVLTEGLDPCVTENYAYDQSGLLQFASRVSIFHGEVAI
ncbi:uncharacterized protein LOC120646768 isoform X2 [Panicum virgatum]|uniref:uncharacterized protein LOC120646768 isoform X2 n=1 Tax=Panicum virgatum TaxID=38727 RepID=UPI0019D626FF|nr:uncharacterized protein LOC120646768 isoform X2 [Panicum virgatum]XP_039779156.1 uncharacterized protein LOC120646768 isoform X2 [Panicum virgatum]